MTRPIQNAWVQGKQYVAGPWLCRKKTCRAENSGNRVKCEKCGKQKR